MMPIKQVCVELPTSAVSVALPAVWCAMQQHHCCSVLQTVQQSTDISCPQGAQQQTGSSGVQWDRATDRWTPDRYTDPALHTM